MEEGPLQDHGRQEAEEDVGGGRGGDPDLPRDALDAPGHREEAGAPEDRGGEEQERGALSASIKNQRDGAAEMHRFAQKFRCGNGAELSALIQERCFFRLKSPIARVAGWDTPYPHAFEWDYFPGPARVRAALEKAMED